MPSFNLTTEPWISCVNNRGKPEEVSLLDLFERTQELRELETDSPVNTVALYRLLLAIIHCAEQGPKNSKEWHELWRRGSFTGSSVIDYLRRNHGNFDIFSKTAPFYQTADFKTDKPLPVSKLTVERASANNKTLFDHTFDGNPPAFTSQEAANALITAQMFSLGGGKGPTSNKYGKHPNYSGCFMNNGATVLLQGDSIFETLMLNLLVYDNKDQPIPNSDDDRPVWERNDAPRPGVYAPLGYLHCLTWKNRHILLMPEIENGMTVVRRMYFGQGESLSFKDIREPMFVYPDGKKPLSLSLDRALWRDSSTLFAFSNSEDKSRPLAFRRAAEALDKGWINSEKSMQCMVLGMVLSRDKGNVLAWRHEELPVSSRILADVELPSILAAALDWTEKVGERLTKAMGKFAGIVLTDGVRPADGKEKNKFIKSLGTEGIYWSSLERPFRELMAKLSSVADISDWRKVVEACARDAFIKTTENSLTRSSRELRARVEALAYFDDEIRKLNSPRKRRANV